ncbi:MAG: PTS glucitol/sorbitol transporter subunit IIA [Propionibacteriaceae bacterium]|nr:PTS glucitol/sorbitol transporter subunit IIA [Propionibacteriaceae bacterium]
MSETIWTSSVVSVGDDAADMFDGGVYILFGEPCPPALADVSLVHSGQPEDAVAIQPGDLFCIGDSCVNVLEVGGLANENFANLGHFVVYLNVGDDELLPGAVKAEGELDLPVAGATVSIRR